MQRRDEWCHMFCSAMSLVFVFIYNADITLNIMWHTHVHVSTLQTQPRSTALVSLPLSMFHGVFSENGWMGFLICCAG